MITIFLYSFLLVSIIYSILGSITKVFYRNKYAEDLSLIERKILNDRASIKDRLIIFSTNLFASVVAPPVYVLAGILTITVLLLTKIDNEGSLLSIGSLVVLVAIMWIIGHKLSNINTVGRLKTLRFVNIIKERDAYKYTYAVTAKQLFQNQYISIIFTSKLPHYMWTDIQEEIENKKIFIDDLRGGGARDIKIGSIAYSLFSETDFENYTIDIHKWEELLKEAVGKQTEFQREYDDLNGVPEF